LYIGEKLWTVLPAGAIVQQHLASFKEFRHRQGHQLGSTLWGWSKRCWGPPPNAKETNPGRAP
jgi:hypothetical protein